MGLEENKQELEEIDKHIVELITRRLSVLKKIHQEKDALNVPLFQNDEREHLKERIDRLSMQFSVNADLIGTVFKHILDESYRSYMSFIRQTSPREATKTIAIIGGTGGMGQFFTRLFESRGHRVLVASEATELTPVSAARQADLVMVSVPIAATIEVIREIAPEVKSGGCILDVTSLKGGPLKAMMEHSASDVEVIGTHPMFGPTVASLLRQVVVICPGRGHGWLNWFRQVCESEGAIIKLAAPSHHDKMMAVIQVLRHFSTIAMGKCLEMLEVDLGESLEFTSPIYRLELAMIGRLFAQNPALYADIEMHNPLTAGVVAEFLRAVSLMTSLVTSGDREGFIEQFRETARYFGDFRNLAMDESNYLISKMVERTS